VVTGPGDKVPSLRKVNRPRNVGMEEASKPVVQLCVVGTPAGRIFKVPAENTVSTPIVRC